LRSYTGIVGQSALERFARSECEEAVARKCGGDLNAASRGKQGKQPPLAGIEVAQGGRNPYQRREAKDEGATDADREEPTGGDAAQGVFGAKSADVSAHGDQHGQRSGDQRPPQSQNSPTVRLSHSVPRDPRPARHA
jgi:hypothetical protein